MHCILPGLCSGEERSSGAVPLPHRQQVGHIFVFHMLEAELQQALLTHNKGSQHQHNSKLTNAPEGTEWAIQIA